MTMSWLQRHSEHERCADRGDDHSGPPDGRGVPENVQIRGFRTEHGRKPPFDPGVHRAWKQNPSRSDGELQHGKSGPVDVVHFAAVALQTNQPSHSERRGQDGLGLSERMQPRVDQERGRAITSGAGAVVSRAEVTPLRPEDRLGADGDGCEGRESIHGAYRGLDRQWTIRNVAPVLQRPGRACSKIELETKPARPGRGSQRENEEEAGAHARRPVSSADGHRTAYRLRSRPGTPRWT